MTTKNKKQPSLYIFETGEDGKDKIVGRAYSHAQGGGFNLLLGGKKYKAFPPKAKTETSDEEEGA